MKSRFKFLILAAVVFIIINSPLSSLAQPYGQTTYNYNQVFMSSAIKTAINSQGFMMAGFLQNALGNSNFYINKTSSGGSFSNPTDFSTRYDIFWSANGLCSPGAQTQLQECTGVSVIETNLNSPSRWYALTGVAGDNGTDYGMFFATLDQNGIPVDQQFYKFPSGSVNPSKPILLEYNGSFIVAGSYELSGVGYMYILRLTPGVNTPVWSDLFSWNNTGSYIVPKDMVYSAISPNSCAVLVGISNNGLNTTGDQGFLSMHSAAVGGAPIDFLTVGHGNNNGVDQFHTIKLVPNAFNGSNFAVGGYSDFNASDGTRWLLYGDGQFNIQFSKIYGPVNDIVGTIVDVEYRVSTTYVTTELYALATSISGMMVLKTDLLGAPFSPTVGPPNPNNEFIYNVLPAPAKIAVPVALTSVTNVTGPDEGLQVFGSQDQITGDGFYFVESYFNGETGCSFPNQTINQFANHASVPSIKQSTIPPRTAGIGACQNFGLGVKVLPYNQNTLCGGMLTVPSGTNARETVGLKSPVNSPGFKCYMNDTQLQIATETNWDVIRVFDQLGRRVWESSSSQNRPPHVSIDMTEQTMGVYYVQLVSGGQIYTHKVVK